MENYWMADTCIEKELDGRNYYLYRHGKSSQKLPIFYWGIMQNQKDAVDKVISYLKAYASDTDFVLVAYMSENWNDAFSPWAAPPVFGTEFFGGKADQTLQWLIEHIPDIESDISEYITNTQERLRFIVGYSLAGLFSLWAYCESSVFSGVVSCSGSFWYDGFLEYLHKQEAAFDRNTKNFIYLSLGDKEDRTKNCRMSSVKSNTEAIYKLICEKNNNLKCTFEWNQGGHFSQPDLRVAKGINWVLKNCV